MRGNAREAVDVEAVRTPSANATAGSPTCTPLTSSPSSCRLASRSGRDPALVEDVICGCISRRQADSAGARTAVLSVGWPESCDAHVHDDARRYPSLALLDVNAA